MNNQNFKIGSQVKYTTPFEDEKNLTFTIVEIETETHWCMLQANVDLVFKPCQVANLSDLTIISNQ